MTKGEIQNAFAESAAGVADAAWVQARRDGILDATFSLLLERGYARTSTLDIATSARISKRDLYQLFKNKEAILTACIERRVERMRLPLALTEPLDRPTLIARLETFGAGVLRELCSPSVIALYRVAAIEADRMPEVARALDTAGRQVTRAALTDVLARAQSAGVLGPGEPSLMAGQFLGLLLGDLPLRLVLGVTASPTPEEVDRRAHAATEVVLRLHPPKEGTYGDT